MAAAARYPHANLEPAPYYRCGSMDADEKPLARACVSAAGAVCYVVVGFFFFCFIALKFPHPISGVTDMPEYAKSFLCARPSARPSARCPHAPATRVRAQTHRWRITSTTSTRVSAPAARRRHPRSDRGLHNRPESLVFRLAIEAAQPRDSEL